MFLRNGYLGTSMDDVAALASVSKQTVYTHFADKQALFTALVLGNIERAEAFLPVALELGHRDDMQRDLAEFARRYLSTVIQPSVLQLRRLVIAEAGRFPDLARTYYKRLPERTVSMLAAALAQLTDRGLLRIDDTIEAASHFAWLILASPLDRAMFFGPTTLPQSDIDRIAAAAVRVFLAAYRVPTS